MTGRIAGLAASTRTGTIRGEDGSHFVFCGAAVLGDFASLAVGHRVSFVIVRGSYTALNVFGEPLRASASGKKRVEAPDLRYTGFHQSDNVRTYSFAELTSFQSAQHCVTVDVALLLKHHIAVQEGPELCLHKLMSDLKDFPESIRHHFGDEDLLALVASRAEALARRRLKRPAAGRRGSPPPTLLPSDGNRASSAVGASSFGSEQASQDFPHVKATVLARLRE
ncbi:MAG: hypothetical protein JWO19_3348 [Bryobacterales bacterium]|nr:hypothetical protein [Bryobacterales bacterium]